MYAATTFSPTGLHKGSVLTTSKLQLRDSTSLKTASRVYPIPPSSSHRPKSTTTFATVQMVLMNPAQLLAPTCLRFLLPHHTAMLISTSIPRWRCLVSTVRTRATYHHTFHSQSSTMASVTTTSAVMEVTSMRVLEESSVRTSVGRLGPSTEKQKKHGKSQWRMLCESRRSTLQTQLD